MGEYSHVVVRTDQKWEHMGQAEALQLYVDSRLGTHGELEERDDGYDVEWTFDQARFGFGGDDEIDQLTDMLTDRNVAWWAIDYGHYDWSEAEFAWRPGMASYAGRTRADEQPVLTAVQYQRIQQLYPEVIVEHVDKHFGDDPKGWMQ